MMRRMGVVGLARGRWSSCPIDKAVSAESTAASEACYSIGKLSRTKIESAVVKSRCRAATEG